MQKMKQFRAIEDIFDTRLERFSARQIKQLPIKQTAILD